ncbi:MAG: hypothetical protein ABFS09_10470 [Thermodesulfobacteriota bacterium]
MKKLFFCSSLPFFVLGTVLLSGQSAMASGGSFMDRIHAADEPFDNTAIETAYQLPVKTVLAKESYQGGTFKVLARKDSISRYRCSVCHTDKKVGVRDGALFTHSDIEVNHGRGDDKLACIECHDEKNRDLLSDAQGKKIDFDHSYQLCGQCHFRQKRDWLGGAHGKRETFWAGERVVLNCTSCHSPHSPAFKTKMPVTYSLPLEE